MVFPAWCACQELDAKQHARLAYQAVLRQRIARERKAEYARLWAEVETLMPIYPYLRVDGQHFLNDR